MTAVYDPEKQCKGKIAYVSRKEAKRITRRTNARHLDFYHCPHCGFWHAATGWGRK